MILALLSDVVIYLGLPLGLWISFRILAFPDLSLEQLFVLGGTLYALLLVKNQSPLLFACSILAISLLLGFVSSFLRNRLSVHPIVISLIGSYIYYSVSLQLLGGPNLSILNETSRPLISTTIFVAILVFALLLVGLHLLARTSVGLRVLAAGSNPKLANRYGISSVIFQAIGLSIAFLLPMASGALFVWRSGSIDVSHGTGFLLISIFVVLAARSVQPRIRPAYNGIVLAAFFLIYLSFLQIVLSLGMPPQWLRGANAFALLLLIVILPGVNGLEIRA